MLFRLSRILFWVAAAAAMAALAGPATLATALTALAGAAVLAAYAAARLGLARGRQAPDPSIDADAPTLLGADALDDILLRVDQALQAAAPALEAAALAAGAVLRAELGCRETTVHRVRELVPPFVDLVTLTPDGQDGVAHRVRLERTPLGVALRDARIVQGEGGAWALPLRNCDAWSALIELGPPALQAAPGAFETLFDAVVQRVEQAGAIGGSHALSRAGHSRDILTPTHAPSALLHAGQEEVCRTQYRETAAMPDPLPACAVPDLPTRPNAPAVLDAQALARLRELDPKGENQLVERVLRAFETSVARLLPQLEMARAGGDRAGVRHVAHTLKSSSASIGALVLSQHCAAVEALIREERADDLEPPLNALVSELASVRLAIHAMLDAA